MKGLFVAPLPDNPHHSYPSCGQIRPSAWRYSVPAVFLPGESWNVEEYDVKNVISYDGEGTEAGIG